MDLVLLPLLVNTLIVILSFLNALFIFIIMQRFMNSKQIVAWVLIALSFILEASSGLLLIQNQGLISEWINFFFILFFSSGITVYSLILLDKFLNFKWYFFLLILLTPLLIVFWLLTTVYSVINSLNLLFLINSLLFSSLLVFLFKGGRLSFYWGLIISGLLLLSFNTLLSNQSTLLIVISNLLFLCGFSRMY